MTGLKAQVLFLLDCGSQDADALSAVTALAGEQPVEVLGLFVEDADLLGAAALPDSVEVSIYTQKITKLDQDSMQQALASQARQIRSIFELAAQRHKLSHTFKVIKGRTIETLVRSAEEKDIVIVGRSLRSGLRVRAGAQYAAFAGSHQDLLFVNEPWSSGSSVVAVLDEHQTPSRAHKTIEKAQAIAATEKLHFIIAHMGTLDHAMSERADQIVSINTMSEESLIELCQRFDARLLVLPGFDGLDWQALLAKLLNNLSCSLLRVA